MGFFLFMNRFRKETQIVTVFEKAEPGVSIQTRAGSKHFPLCNSSRAKFYDMTKRCVEFLGPAKKGAACSMQNPLLLKSNATVRTGGYQSRPNRLSAHGFIKHFEKSPSETPNHGSTALYRGARFDDCFQ